MLGISPTSDPEKIREAYLARVREHHPDRYRLDPARYRHQEEMMKRINEAYDWALKHPPETKPSATVARTSETGTPEPPIMCPTHRYQALRRCKRCQQPLCVGCVGFRQSLCTRHHHRQKVVSHRLRVLREWGPLIAIIFGLRSIGLPGLDVGIATLIYLALLGLRLLLTHRWFGCLAVLLLPYSLVLAGLWSLWESVRAWNGEKTKPGRSG